MIEFNSPDYHRGYLGHIVKQLAKIVVVDNKKFIHTKFECSCGMSWGEVGDFKI